MENLETTISDNLYIRKLTVGELNSAYPIIKQIRPHLTRIEFVELTTKMMLDGYHAICLFEDGRIVSYAGFAKLISLTFGEHIWVYDLATDNRYRGKGYGKILLTHLMDVAKKNSIKKVALSAGIAQHEPYNANDKKMGFDRVSSVYEVSV
jgi:GNAT superfamily N-acetyltransferase